MVKIISMNEEYLLFCLDSPNLQGVITRIKDYPKQLCYND